jgi:biotin operon repressor
MIKEILRIIRRLIMARKPSSSGSSRSRKKTAELQPLRYEFDTLTESEQALVEANWSPTLLKDIEEFRRKHNITPEIIEEKRQQGFNIADVVSLEVTGIHSDALEIERMQGSFHSLAESEDQLDLVRQLELVRRENKRLKSGDAIVLPVSKSQVVNSISWLKQHGFKILTGFLVLYVVWTLIPKQGSEPKPEQAKPALNKDSKN